MWDQAPVWVGTFELPKADTMSLIPAALYRASGCTLISGELHPFLTFVPMLS